MQTIGTAFEVLICIGESDRWGHKPLYMAILEMLRQEDCAGATAIRWLAGFGAASRIHTATIVARSEDLPLVIHWVDLPDRVERVMPGLVEMVAEGLITARRQGVEIGGEGPLARVPIEWRAARAEPAGEFPMMLPCAAPLCQSFNSGGVGFTVLRKRPRFWNAIGTCAKCLFYGTLGV
jgi:PII-like signaling protein